MGEKKNVIILPVISWFVHSRQEIFQKGIPWTAHFWFPVWSKAGIKTWRSTSPDLITRLLDGACNCPRGCKQGYRPAHAGPGGLSKEQVVTSSKADEMRDYHRFKEEKAWGWISDTLLLKKKKKKSDQSFLIIRRWQKKKNKTSTAELVRANA